MTPLYTVLLCLPAGLALIISVCGLAVLWPPPAGGLMGGSQAHLKSSTHENFRQSRVVVSPYLADNSAGLKIR
jgi:hypothetical protein